MFLNIINYLGPGTSYDKWVKAYGCSFEKSWLLYEWLDSPEKLKYPGSPEKGMQTFADWLCYYNDRDIEPGLEALDKMQAFYSDKGVDNLKDAASILGVSLHYLLRGSIERGTELYSPSKEAYNMLKAAVVGGQSLVFTGYHKAGLTKIKSHRFPDPKLCKRIIGYDATVLYLSTMLREMPCGEEKIVHYTNPAEVAKNLTERLKAGTWFGFAEEDIAVSQWAKFEGMPPFFYNKQVPEEAVP